MGCSDVLEVFVYLSIFQVFGEWIFVGLNDKGKVVSVYSRFGPTFGPKKGPERKDFG